LLKGTGKKREIGLGQKKEDTGDRGDGIEIPGRAGGSAGDKERKTVIAERGNFLCMDPVSFLKPIRVAPSGIHWISGRHL
jgi:hypothetical protein